MSPALPPGQQVELRDGSTTLVRRFGTGTGPPLLLVHGWWVNADLNWAFNYPYLQGQRQIITFDLPGHGRGSARRERFSLRSCVNDAIDVLDHCRVDEAIVVGYSMGGCVAQLLAQHHASRVAGTVLCATSRNFRGKGLERARFSLLTPVSLAAGTAPATWRQRVFDWGLPKRMGSLGAWATKEIARGDLQRILEAGTELYRFNSEPWIGALPGPAAVVVTGNDRTVPTNRQRKLAAALPAGSTMHEVAGDHEVCITNPESFSTALLAAIDGLSQRPTRGAGKQVR